MKYKYEFKTISLSPTRKFLGIKLPDKIALVETFLTADIQGDGSGFLEAIDKVLNGYEEYQEYGGNICILEIRKNKTKILDSLAEDGKGNDCEIETSELKDLIEVWLEERKSFYRS